MKALIYLMLCIAVFGAALYGWVQNLLIVLNTDLATGELVVRGIGIPLAGLGAIMGYF